MQRLLAQVISCSFLSDRAKALIKLAITGFDCNSGADLFHAQQDVSRWLGAKLGNRSKSAQKELEATQHAENKAFSSVTESEQIMLQEKKLPIQFLHTELLLPG